MRRPRATPSSGSPTDPAFLSHVVQFDRPRLGDLTGLRGVHLQCHIGTDTVSLARLGARMTGLDFSAPALAEARQVAEVAGVDVEFVEADTYDAVSVLGAGPVRPGLHRDRRAVLAPGHPALGRGRRRPAQPRRPAVPARGPPGAVGVWTTPGRDGLLVLGFPYFEVADPIAFTEEGTYVETDVRFEHNTSYSWNHGLGEIVTALLDRGWC